MKSSSGHVSTNPNPILVIGPSWVGDMIMAQSLFITLHKQQPDAMIDVIAPPWCLPLLERMPEVRMALPLAVAHGELALLRRWRLGRSLRQTGYGQAIVLPRSAKSAIPPMVAQIPQRTGYIGEFRYGLLNDIRPKNKKIYRTVDRFVNLGIDPGQSFPQSIPNPKLAIDAESQKNTLLAFKLQPGNKPVLALCPGAEYGAAKRWPKEHYAFVARDSIKKGWQVWLLGSERDRPVTQAIAAEVPGTTDLAGRTSLSQVVDLLSLATAVVSNDSGLMHVAAGVDVPVIVLYGSSDPNYTPPLNKKARFLCLNLECSPCFKANCPQGHLNCLRQIAPEQVISLLEELQEQGFIGS